MANMTDATKILDETIAMTKKSVQRTKEELVSKMRSLSEAMQRKAERLAMLPDEVMTTGGPVNSLGEVQTAGQDIDRLCAVLTERANTLDALQYIRSRIKE